MKGEILPQKEDRFRAFLMALIRVPKTEIDRLEADRPKRGKRKKPDAA